MTSLKKLWEESHALAFLFSEETPSSPLFQNLLGQFRALEKEEDPSLQKIGRLARIFDGRWDRRQWLNLLVPLERYLDRRLTDVELIGFQPDRETSVQEKLPLTVIVDHWRSAFNVGSLFRMADGFGIQEILLVGYTPTPDQASVKKTALGSELHTPWQHFETLSFAIDYLREKNIPLWALETAPSAQILGSSPLPSTMGLLLGNERFGLDHQALALCEGLIRIPLRGHKNSINAASAFGVFAYEWCRQHANI